MCLEQDGHALLVDSWVRALEVLAAEHASNGALVDGKLITRGTYYGVTVLLVLAAGREIVLELLLASARVVEVVAVVPASLVRGAVS